MALIRQPIIPLTVLGLAGAVAPRHTRALLVGAFRAAAMLLPPPVSRLLLKATGGDGVELVEGHGEYSPMLEEEEPPLALREEKDDSVLGG